MSAAPARPAADRAPPFWVALVLLLVAALSWAGSGVAGRAAAGNVPPMTLSFLRWVIALALFMPLGGAAFWRQRAAVAAHWPIIGAFALFGVVGFTVPYYVGLQFTPAVHVALLNASTPVMIVLLSFAMFGARVSRIQTAGILLALAGSIVIVVRGSAGALMDLQFNTGDLLVLVSFSSWAMYTVMLRWKPADLDGNAFLVAITLVATAMILPLYAWELAAGRSFAPTTGNLAIILYAAVFPSVVAYICWNRAVAVVGPNIAGATQYLIPVFGIILAVLILGESVEAYHLVGIAAIFAGVYLSTSRRFRPAARSAPPTGDA